MEEQMHRLSALSRSPKRTLGVLAVVLAAIGVAVGSGASFTSGSSNPSNTFTAGLLHHSNTAGGSLVSTTISNIKPGFGTTGSSSDAVDATGTSAGYGQVVIANDGTLPGTFTVSQTESGSAYTGTNPLASAVCGGTCSALDGALKVRITKTDATGGEVTLYDGLVSGLASANLGSSSGATFSLNAGESRTYKAYFYLPLSTGNAFQGGSATVNLSFAETQQ
jgi:hypothetical protein